MVSNRVGNRYAYAYLLDEAGRNAYDTTIEPTVLTHAFATKLLAGKRLSYIQSFIGKLPPDLQAMSEGLDVFPLSWGKWIVYNPFMNAHFQKQ